MTQLDPAALGLLIMAVVLILGIGSAALGMFLADRFRCWRERRNLKRCIAAARREADIRSGECSY